MDLIDGRYRLVRSLGCGGYGRVYEAFDLFTTKWCAVKVAHDDNLRMSGSKEMLAREFETISSLPEHHNCIKVLGGGDGYYVMEKFGNPIFVNRASCFKFRFVYKVMMGLFRALNHYHTHGFLHLDVKPNNILVDVDRRNKLLGTKLIDPLLVPKNTADTVFFGTAEYSSPEFLASANGATIKADLYAAGLVFYELLTGAMPFPDSGGNIESVYRSHLDGAYRPLSDKWSLGIRRLVNELLKPNANDRPRDALCCIERLKSCVRWWGNNQQG